LARPTRKAGPTFPSDRPFFVRLGYFMKPSPVNHEAGRVGVSAFLWALN
jgi:hypothetical protein